MATFNQTGQTVVNQINFDESNKKIIRGLGDQLHNLSCAVINSDENLGEELGKISLKLWELGGVK